VSQENVELTRLAYEAWNNGDLDWMLDHMTEDFEFRPGLGFADIDPIIRGKDGWRRFSEMWHEAWEEITVRVERLAPLRAGQVSKLTSIAGWDEALEAVGLRE
jgi:ketosteroid isomerase-like protein